MVVLFYFGTDFLFDVDGEHKVLWLSPSQLLLLLLLLILSTMVLRHSRVLLVQYISSKLNNFSFFQHIFLPSTILLTLKMSPL